MDKKDRFKPDHDRKLILEDGSVYEGYGFGSEDERFFELVFNTSMAGYQEILTDRSYTDQAVVMTYPVIGNYGICDDDDESDSPKISGLVVRQFCDRPSNFRCASTIDEFMKNHGIAGISGVDTRNITRHIRNNGSCKAVITSAQRDTGKVLEELRDFTPPTDQVARASTEKIYTIDPKGALANKRPVVVIDCGIKKNILRMLSARNFRLVVVPWNTSADTVLEYDPCGVFISNGPGDPSDCIPAIETIRNLRGKIPIFGICLGHQIISLAYGARTYKLKFGHRGGNHPVRNNSTGNIEITSQNHSFAVVPESIEGTGLDITHVNLLDDTVEGIACEKDMVFSVQYHPESAPGPCDSTYLFDNFETLIAQYDKKRSEHA
ncbi:MAG: glutamine-hydrolyzing carbamoyl-phosphate synthase small subunit [Lachnospiraceae bacterium]|nr:glutamine-hydrolyzing carbamoyl-phosphate synthase small subunit [Lachnospiraceae bacterium]